MSRQLARLRRLSAENASRGTAESRDYTITAFLSEMSAVVCEDVLDLTPDNVLYWLYAEWTRAVIAEESEEDRRRRLVSAITVFPRTELNRLPEQSNVVSLYG